MIGLEYILSLYNMQHIELAEKLGIRKQNINMWIKGKQNIPKKYLPILEELFGLKGEYFTRELDEIDQLEIQKEKLKSDLKPVIKKHEQQFMIGKVNDIVEVPVYDKEEINTIERDIEKAKLVSRFKEALDIVDNNPYMDTYKLIVELLEKVQHEVILHKTIEALAHYYEVLPDWVATGPEQDEFEEDIFEVFDDYNY
ncbi:transcriptional regulator [Tissierella sp. P1]|uniref:Helix-turn-helix domain-containing protein n=1 Tax=Tissierella carlieri TaxID=689904 RepID=A0ABT1S4R5_9FIRM|nr:MULTISPECIES: helix-turn-helix domain-containing protein [Tissierella]MCQ4921461.1 helix-turn-helix domain-containing protein [Tissierella carlieri]MDU5081600.1 helix-turn-helix domain-containing protein [Bacillota bacterium]OZV12687.1 transcriptional regulator [Tissierella sp. P1]